MIEDQHVQTFFCMFLGLWPRSCGAPRHFSVFLPRSPAARGENPSDREFLNSSTDYRRTRTSTEPLKSQRVCLQTLKTIRSSWGQKRSFVKTRDARELSAPDWKKTITLILKIFADNKKNKNKTNQDGWFWSSLCWCHTHRSTDQTLIVSSRRKLQQIQAWNLSFLWG